MCLDRSENSDPDYLVRYNHHRTNLYLIPMISLTMMTHSDAGVAVLGFVEVEIVVAVSC